MTVETRRRWPQSVPPGVHFLRVAQQPERPRDMRETSGAKPPVETTPGCDGMADMKGSDFFGFHP